jgi:hypothetical protein
VLKDITKREKILGALTVSVAVVTVAYGFIMEPLINRWNALGRDISDKKGLLAKHSRILRNNDEIEKLHSEYTRYFQTEKLSPEEESASALSNIEKLARETNAHITNIKPLSTKNYENYTKFTFRVTTESRIGELAKFIYKLQSSEQLLKIERMVLRAKERSPDTIKAILHINKVSVF